MNVFRLSVNAFSAQMQMAQWSPMMIAVFFARVTAV
jgi:hypothetical protein